MKKPVAFMSYSHRDDTDERLTLLRERLSKEVSQQLGEDIEIFQDRHGISWGQNWKERIDDTLDQVTFLIAIVSPSFFNSLQCRNELERFIDREKSLRHTDLILPIYYVDTPLMSNEAKPATDELAQIIASRQYVDWRDLRTEPLDSPQIPKKLAELGTQFRFALDQALQAEERRSRLGKLYQRARRWHRDGQWQEVVDAFAEIHAEDPNYADPEGLLESACEALKTQEPIQDLEASEQTSHEGEELTPSSPSLGDAIEEADQTMGATAAAQRKAGELGVDSSKLVGSGSDGTVIVKDVVRAALSPPTSDPFEIKLSNVENIRPSRRLKKPPDLNNLIDSLRKKLILSLAFSPNGDLLASGGEKQTVEIWSMEHKVHVRSLNVPNMEGDVHSLAFSSNADMLASAGASRSLQESFDYPRVRLWSVNEDESLDELSALGQEPKVGDVNSVAFSPRENLLATASIDEGLLLWSVEAGNKLVFKRRLSVPGLNEATSVAFSLGGST
jgi:TIR domain/WD domain, G-beta repeat